MSQGPIRNSFQRVLINVAFITGSNVIGRVLNLALYAALGRMFGPEGLGGYATAVAFSTYFIFAVDFGVSPRLVREGAIAPEELEEEFAQAFGIKLAMTGLTLVGLAGLHFVLPFESWVVELCVLLALASIVRSFAYLSESVCRARERLDLAGASGLANTSLFVGSSLLFFYLDFPVVAIGWASLGSAFLHLGISSLFARKFISLGVRIPPKWSIVRAALPYATTSLSMLAFAQIDVLVISFIKDAEFVGRYSAISRLLLIASTFGSLSASAVLPTASRVFANAARQRFDEIFNGALRVIFSIGVTAALGIVVLARWIMQTIYGDAFADLYPFLQVGAVYLVFKFAISVLAMVLTSSGRQGDRARGILIGLFFTVVFVLLLVPRFGISGAVAALILSEFVLLSCFIFSLRVHLDWRVLAQTLLSLGIASGAALATYLHFSQQAGSSAIALSIAAPTITFLVLLFATGEGFRSIRFVLGLRAQRTSPPSAPVSG